MKQMKQGAVLFCAVLITVATYFTGCSSTGVERSEKATTTMQTMNNDIRFIVAQLSATGTSLSDLTQPDQSDIRKGFDTYTENVNKMSSLEKQFTKHTNQMKLRGKEYFEEWQKDGAQYKNRQIQDLSEQRRQELGEIYGRIAENSVGVKEALRAYVSDISEIQMYLSNDLTVKGIQVIVPITQRVVSDGENLSFAIRSVQTSIDRARLEMAQGGR
jgi:hypothetical protein